MIYSSGKEWLAAPQKRVLLFGMSGLGKTYLSNMLRATGQWYHYSVDYRIGTRYMGEYITDNAKALAMQVPLLRELLMSDSIYIGSNISFENLSPLSTYLGKPGDPSKGGLPIAEYQRRQAQHEQAETLALLDTPYFAERSERIYGYPNFVCDSGGSICEVVDPENSNDPVLTALSQAVLMVWIEGTEADTEALIHRFDKAPKPMCYQPAFLAQAWSDYCSDTGQTESSVDPDAFIRWTYARAMAHRAPRYAAMARNWGIKISAEEVSQVKNSDGLATLIAHALDRKTG
ncbi:ATPases of the AAA+ class [Candidatus Rhodobacter oscarellae]|uniref:ATPases of the AAA+ class n=1 Tax=Candidatus Rhodobacter oscarellae TaxID=1675527 RepID=A0A0J9E6M9_9RHOB|nr:hypothetical protein [Candidatus Rhodobacter lobularis]KMW57479.1 ATPases of the AAA+ class [Candidatus Rhodobacter lobularis]